MKKLMISLLLSLFVIFPIAQARAEQPTLFLVCNDEKIALIIFEEAMEKLPYTSQLAIQTGICKPYPEATLVSNWRSLTKQITPTTTDFEGDRIAVFEYLNEDLGKSVYLFILNPDGGDAAQANKETI